MYRKYKIKYTSTHKGGAGPHFPLQMQMERLEEFPEKYEEWKSKGYKFGCITNPPDQVVEVWTDMNGNEIAINVVIDNSNRETIQHEYDLQTCFPIFEKVREGTMEELPKYLMDNVPIKKFVAQNNFAIVEKEKTLTTIGLATCVGLGMEIGNKKFMAHIEEFTDIEPIIRAIQGTVMDEGLIIHTPEGIYTNIKIWLGSYPGMSIIQQDPRTMYGADPTNVDKAYSILEALGIPRNSPNITTKQVCFKDEVDL